MNKLIIALGMFCLILVCGCQDNIQPNKNASAFTAKWPGLFKEKKTEKPANAERANSSDADTDK